MDSTLAVKLSLNIELFINCQIINFNNVTLSNYFNLTFTEETFLEKQKEEKRKRAQNKCKDYLLDFAMHFIRVSRGKMGENSGSIYPFPPECVMLLINKWTIYQFLSTPITKYIHYQIVENILKIYCYREKYENIL